MYNALPARTVGGMAFIKALLVCLAGSLGFNGYVVDAEAAANSSPSISGQIVYASRRVTSDVVSYKVYVYGLRDTNEVTGAYPSIQGAYFNSDGIFLDGREVPCPLFAYRHSYRRGVSLVTVRIPRSCLPAASTSTVNLTLLSREAHETAYAVFSVAGTWTLPAPRR